ncbi:MAG: 16S rRNA (cytidine(1402)-2'-O)-methyltransferase [Promicromonosporaceae bacterium]|nr:16S rRNA (cytidine(1402)-2'-O)-methyltransferase [Promicromonosporaceae bacterium]
MSPYVEPGTEIPPGKETPNNHGLLVLAGTPIGNTGDASPRLRELLTSADVIAAEDTRKLRALATRLNLKPTGKILAYHEHNEAAVTSELLDLVAAGALVAMVSDAGMPAVSDPGYRLVAAASARNLPVTCVPGPSAVTTALALSGLPSDRFTFEGFLPRKSGERNTLLAELAAEPRTMVFFEAPHRVVESVRALRQAFGADRRVAFCRELTKTFEEVIRTTLAELEQALLARAAEPTGIRGEIVIVVAGRPKISAPPLEELAELARRRRDEGGLSLKDAVAEVAQGYGVSRRELYNLCLAK